MPEPLLSVLVTFGNLPGRAAECLRGVYSQEGIQDCEVIVVDIGTTSKRELFDEFRALKYLHRPEARHIGKARLAALHESSAPLVAYLEDHTVPRPGWLQAILRAFREHPEVAVINYSLANMLPHTRSTRSFHMLEYGPWAHPARSGFIRYACHHNLAYRREVLERFVAGDADRLETEYLVHRQILASGGKLWLAADAVIEHQSWTRVRDGLEANSTLKRVIAAERARRENWTLLRRCAYAGGMLLCPGLLLWRLTRTIIPRPQLWAEFLYALPLVLFVYSYISAQEALGYLTGDDGTRDRFTNVEYNIERRV